LGRTTKTTGKNPGDGNYPKFGSIPRLNRDITVTEKIDGTNGLICLEKHQFGSSIELEDNPDPTILGFWFDEELSEDGLPEYEWWVRAGSRNRWITPSQDNAGFAAWVYENGPSLIKDLGEGHHYGEWWGSGINRGYDLPKGEKRFSLFNANRWYGVGFQTVNLGVVPEMARSTGKYLNVVVDAEIDYLKRYGSLAQPGYMRPEGVVIYHRAMNGYFKVTIEHDEIPKKIQTLRDDAEMRRRGIQIGDNNVQVNSWFENEMVAA